ncbi:MAG: 2Fe-2S iron-sulfur cluster binding domain-containing protein [Treponema sp.]|nr:2Fe-2S iron-sulfur cluster binding domain-containing protein [Treponema sp.]
MKIPVTLNQVKVILDAQADEPLLKVLRKNGCTSVKNGCMEGGCGSCTVLLNDIPVASCKIPVGLVKDMEIITLDFFEKSDFYTIIMDGFNKAGIKLCGYCNSGKIFSAYQILKNTKIPTRQEIKEQMQHLSSCCTDLETLVNGVIYAMQLQAKRLKRVTKIEGER